MANEVKTTTTRKPTHEQAVCSEFSDSCHLAERRLGHSWGNIIMHKIKDSSSKANIFKFIQLQIQLDIEVSWTVLSTLALLKLINGLNKLEGMFLATLSNLM